MVDPTAGETTSALIVGATRDVAAFRLLRMVLIDSYSPGRVVEVRLDGHMTLTGENGGGKTTLLRLIPIFFGESPSKVIFSDENNHSFARHYFPHSTSYVVFEYERRGTPVMSVIHVGQGDTVVYRFVDSPYRVDLFNDVAGPIQSRDFTRHLAKHGVSESKPLSRSAYRAILQNTAINREHRHLAGRFAFVGSGGHLTHLERVITAILQRATTFVDLRRMIVASVMESQEAFAMRAGKSDLKNWIASYEAHHAVMACAPTMEALEREDALRRAHEQDFGKLHAALHLLREHFQTAVTTAEQEVSRLRMLSEKTTADYQTRLGICSDDLATRHSEHTTLVNRRSLLLARKQHYDKTNMVQQSMRFDAIPSNEEAKRQAKINLDSLNDSAQSIGQIFEGMMNDARARANAEVGRHEARRTELLKAHNQRTATLVDQQRLDMDALVSQQHDASQAAGAVVADRRVEVAQLEAQAHNPAYPPELDAALHTAREQQSDANQVLDALHEGTSALDAAYKKCQREFLEAENDLNGSLTTAERVDLEIESLVAAHSAGANTLLGFLRLNKPSWAQDIGRVLPENILLRTDLAPTLSEGEDLYGVSIAVERLPAGRLASDEAIQAALHTLRNKSAKTKEDIATDRKNLKDKGELRERSKKAVDAHQVKINQAKQTRQDCDRRVQMAIHSVRNSREAARREAQQALQVGQDRLNAAQAEVLRLQAVHTASVEALRRAQREARSSLDKEHQAELFVVDEAIRHQKSTLSEELGRLGDQRNASLAEKGVDVSVLNGLVQKIATLTTEIETAQGFAGAVLEYRTWLVTDWVKRDQLDTEIATAKRAENVAAAAVDALKTERDHALDALAQRIKTVTDDMAAADRQARQVGQQLVSLAIWPRDEATLAKGIDIAWNIDLLAERRRDLQTSYHLIQQRIRDGVEEIRRAMVAYPGTGPDKYYQTMLSQLDFPESGREYLWIESLRGWFNNGQAEHRDSVIQYGKTMALNISSFWDGLAKFKKEVETFASDLRQHLHRGKLFANISDVSATISVDVDKQNYWSVIENLHYAFEAWHNTIGNNLPPPTFVDAAREVANVLSSDQGLVAEPIDLISLQITASIDGDGTKVATNESALARMSSNGLSYVILCVILQGFVNRIRRKQDIQIPYPVDELRDLSTNNAMALLQLLAQNRMSLVAAFPDIDPELAPFFERNYRIQPGRVLASIQVDDEEAAYV